MSLRFTQSLTLSTPHRVPDRNLELRASSMIHCLEEEGPRNLILPFGTGGNLLYGVRGEIPVSQNPEEVKESLDSLRLPRSPKWLMGRFRPRNLTLEGESFLHCLDPSLVTKKNEGVPILLDSSWMSLEDRLVYLRRKYLALDMLRKGLVVEVDGRFWPSELSIDIDQLDAIAATRRRETMPHGPLKIEDALIWLGAFREASWDQMRSLHLPHQKHVDAVLQDMIDQDLVNIHRVHIGHGSLTTLRLSRLGMTVFRQLPEAKELIQRGFGPRKNGRGIGEYHEQAVGDAIGYFGHEIQASGGRVTGIALESMLRREYQGVPHFPDFRIEYETDLGRSHWDVEVLGVGGGYKTAKKTSKLQTSATVRGFDPLGRTAATRDKDVRIFR